MASCICECGGVEALNACATPKVNVGSTQSGSISICNSKDDGIGFGNFPVIMTSGCRYVGSIERSDTSNAWLFNFTGAVTELGGAVAVFPTTPDPHCTPFIVSWGVGADGGPFITVRGETSVTSPGSGILGGTALAVAVDSEAWVLGTGTKGLMLFEDAEDMTFEDAQQMQFSI